MSTARSAGLRVDRDRVISETIDREVVIIDLATGHYFTLNGTAGEVWELLEGFTTTSHIVATLTARYGAAPNEVEDAILAFLARLEEARLVVPAGGDDLTEAPPALAAPAGDAPRPAFIAPQLEVYTDMAHIIGMDPIAGVDTERGWPRERQQA